MRTLIDFFKRKTPTPRSAATLRMEAGGLQAMGDVPRYPPFTQGLPAATPAQLLATQQTLIRQLMHELALPDELNDKLISPLLESYAAFVHLIPASRAHHHRGAGGLLRHGLEVALWATRSFHGHIIDGHVSGERRKILEPRWRLAVCISALCHDLGKPAYDLEISDASGRLTWDVYGGLLCQWMEHNDIDRYFIRWRSTRQHKAHERFSHLLTMRVIPHQVLSYLNEGDPRIIAVMHETIAGQIPKGSARVIYDLIMQADQRSVQRDLKGQRLAESDQALGVPVAKYIIDAMKRLIHDGSWRANQPDQPLWVSDESLYIDWQMAVPQLTRLLEKDRVSGIPKSPDSIAESLADYDMIVIHKTDNDDDSFYVMGCPEKRASTKAVPRLQLVEINGLEVLFDGPHPAPVTVHVGEAALEAREQANATRERKKAQERSQKKDQLLAKMTLKGESRPQMPASEPAPGAESDNADASAAAHEQPTPEQPVAEHAAQDGGSPACATHTQSKREATTTSADTNAGRTTPTDEPTTDPDESASKAREAKQAQQWLNQQGGVGQILRICALPGFPGSRAFRHGQRVAIPYPEGMEQFGDQRQENLALIKPYLQPHPTVPNKPTQKLHIEGESKPLNALVLNDRTSAHLLALTAAPQQPISEQGETTTKSEAPPEQDPQKAQRKVEHKVAKSKPASKGNAVSQEKPQPPTSDDRKRAVARAQAFFNAVHENNTSFKKITDGQGRGVWVPYRMALDWYINEIVPGTRIMEVIPALFKAGVMTTEIPEGESEKHLLVLDQQLE